MLQYVTFSDKNVRAYIFIILPAILSFMFGFAKLFVIIMHRFHSLYYIQPID